MPDPTPADAWTRFERALADHVPSLRDALAPPAAGEALDDLARVAGADLAVAAGDLYAHHDGQTRLTPGLFFGLRFLPAREAAVEWQRWTDLLRDQPSLADEIAVTAHPPGAVRPVYASPAWLPFASDGAGNHLALDLEPGPAGTPGQVLSFGADESVRHVLADSVAAFLDACAQAVESGVAAAVPDPDADGGLALHIQGASHLFDVLPDWTGGAPDR